jgi:hypothetical protein
VNRRSFLKAVAPLVGAAACNRPAALTDSFSSADEAARAMLDAVATKDRTRLEAIALNEREFKDHVWPELPAARPERNLPFSYVWGDLHQKSTQALTVLLARQGGKRYQLQRVRFSDMTQYPSYVVHRESSFDVIDAAGKPQAMQLSGSMFEQNGRWKIFSYVVD